DSFKPGDILVDVTVPLATAVEGKPTRTLGVWQGSAGEQARELVPSRVKVVSAFNNVSAEQLQDLKSRVDCDVIVCGDDEDAKRTVMGLVRELPGARPIDGGPLENARIVEQLTALLISINLNYGVTSAGVRITGIPA
ncbi:MAG: NADPH-dependent F420 reductase, partial [Candidatus Bathyarchaeia archaeon]